MRLSSLLSLLASSPLIHGKMKHRISSSSIPSTYKLYEKRQQPSGAWIKRDRATSSAIVPVQIGLTQQRLHKGYDYLLAVSDPGSPNYARYWTEEEVHSTFAPKDQTTNAVKQWLAKSGIDLARVQHSVNRGWIHFDTTVAHLESLIQAEFYEHRHATTGVYSLGTDEYYLPFHLHEHIDYISPGVKHRRLTKRLVSTIRDRPRYRTNDPQRNQRSDASDCDKLVTPDCIAALYQIPTTARRAISGNELGILEWNDAYAQEDLDHAFRTFDSMIPRGTHPILRSIDGGVAPKPPSEAGPESSLDLQVAYPLIYPQQIVLYQSDDRLYTNTTLEAVHFDQTILEVLDGSYCNYTMGETGSDKPNAGLNTSHASPILGKYSSESLMCDTYKPTNVISISYGMQEIDLPVLYQQRLCNEFLKFGLRGVSIVISTGDNGVAGFTDELSAGNGCLGKEGRIFNPPSPNTCPYVTNVGATMISSNGTTRDPESAAFGFFEADGRGASPVLFTSSGGFSNIFPVPTYQKKAIDTYFKQHSPSYHSYKVLGGFDEYKIGDGRFNRIGHGVPDVTALGYRIAVYLNSKLVLLGGTSASAPIFASMLTLINEARLQAGKRTIGFVNPALYAHPKLLNDITNGTNPGCGTQGFEAVKGWDPVTGLGSPNFPRMLRFFMSLDDGGPKRKSLAFSFELLYVRAGALVSFSVLLIVIHILYKHGTWKIVGRGQ